MSNPLDPEVMSSAIGGLEEAASLSATADLPEARLARGILRYRLKAADERKKDLDLPRQSSDECLEPSSASPLFPWQVGFSSSKARLGRDTPSPRAPMSLRRSNLCAPTHRTGRGLRRSSFQPQTERAGGLIR